MFILSLVSAAYAGKYAVLYCGSNTWSNYRHQADIFTIYGKLLSNGYKKSEIKLMAYDDIAASTRNPYKGMIYHNTKHDPNVYPGTEAIDVKGADMTADNFYKALTGLPTTANDYVFIYYDNHGGPGILGVPEGCGTYITTAGLTAALDGMKGKYKNALFGIEACYAGSVASGFKAANLATITAANDKESSYAAVYDSKIGAYLSNEFTNYWIGEMEANPTETIGDLYTNLKTSTSGSHVMFYGDESMQSMTVDTFFGAGSKSVRETRQVDIVPQRVASAMALEHLKIHGASDEVRKTARLQLIKSQAVSEKLEIILDHLIKAVDSSNGDDVRMATSLPCDDGYFKALNLFVKRFGTVNPDDYGRFMIIKNLCAKFGHEKVIEGIKKVL